MVLPHCFFKNRHGAAESAFCSVKLARFRVQRAQVRQHGAYFAVVWAQTAAKPAQNAQVYLHRVSGSPTVGQDRCKSRLVRGQRNRIAWADSPPYRYAALCETQSLRVALACVRNSSEVMVERRDEIAAIRAITQSQHQPQRTPIHPACQGKPSGVFAQDSKIVQECREKERVGRTRAVGESKRAAKSSRCRRVVS
jgi:hypothetical protein